MLDRALDDQCLQALGCAVDGGAEPGRTATDDEQVHFLARRELEPYSECPRDLSRSGVAQLGTARKAHQRLIGCGKVRDESECLTFADQLGVVPGVGQPVTPREVDHRPGGDGRARSDDLDPQSIQPLQQLPPGHERRQQQVAETPILVEQRPEPLAVDRDVAHRVRDHGGEVHGLAGEEIDLAKEAGGTVASDLVPLGIEDRRLAFANGDEGIPAIADSEQHLAHAPSRSSPSAASVSSCSGESSGRAGEAMHSG
ncbi:MAG TPA: hypothetical protein VLP43_10390 [Solirubrobacteraceae bacterium]|nr:hypothetical protein [Solirubrobacteraceae bacterium]